MSGSLYAQGAKNSWKPLVIFAAVLAMYFSVIATMFDPGMGSALAELHKAMPQLFAAMGMSAGESSLLGFMSSYLYGFLVPVLPMVYTILVANALVAKRVDDGSMATLLAAPVHRRKIALTQAAVLLSGVFLLLALCTGIGLASAEAFFPGQLDAGKFLLLNLGALGLHIFISGLCFFSSCLANTSKLSLALGAGLPTLCYVIKMLADAGEQTQNFKYATFFTLFNPQGIAAGEAGAYWGAAGLAAAGAALYALGCVVFVKKDMPV